ncbi:hypothetical protein RHMOL_Rhmol02G0221000 [Rhododendron molle]|uniref:Uncharacterized protein n=1 Tax=Rhododendron molle TaxID=49168 RepID=A0ACC0PSG9_RHOML|nr:hypothetical protein RHMOL_Rhmol02G0221000 [Rhododendron molle]
MSFLKKLDTTKKYSRHTVNAVINPQKGPDHITELSVLLRSLVVRGLDTTTLKLICSNKPVVPRSVTPWIPLRLTIRVLERSSLIRSVL